MEIVLPEPVRMLAQEVRRFIQQEVEPLNSVIEETDEVPQDLVGKAKDMGLFGLTIPEEYGGIGLNTVGKCAIDEELGRSNYGFATLIGNHTGISTMGIVAFGSDEQKEKYLPAMAAGELIGAFALTEAQAGSDAANLRTTAVRDGDSWILNGEKIFITNARGAGLFTVMAVTDKSKGAKGISAFLVEGNAPGVIVGPNESKMGMRGAHTASITFQDCRIPADALLGQEGQGYVSALKILTKGRATLGARACGMASRLLELAMDHARERVQFGQPIANFQGIRWMLADTAMELHAARLMVYNAASMLDRGEKAIKEAAMAKLFASEMLWRAADKAVQIHGGMGYMRGMMVEQFYRDCRIFRIYEGTSEIQRNIIASRILDE